MPSADSAPDVRWTRVEELDGGRDDALLAHVRDLLGSGDRISGTVEVGRHCPLCGSSDHGRPWARHLPAGGASREVWVSLSRAAGYVVTAVSLSGPVGVDVEVVADVDRAWAPDLVLAPGEAAGTPAERAWVWTAKEALLKLRGTGLATPMSEVRLDDGAARVRPLPAPDPRLAAALAGARPTAALPGRRRRRWSAPR